MDTTNDTGPVNIPDSELAHFGVLGMRWGVRRANRSEKQLQRANIAQKNADLYKSISDYRSNPLTRLDAKTTQKAADRQWKKVDKDWQSAVLSSESNTKVYNSMCEKVNPRIAALNAKPEYSVDFRDSAHAQALSNYTKEYVKAVNLSFDEATKDLFGDSPSGRKEATWVSNPGWPDDGSDVLGRLAVIDKPEHVRHANSEDVVYEIPMVLNSKGLLDPPELIKVDSNNLKHYGVPGMRWGVHQGSTSPQSVSVKAKPGKYVQTKGGRKINASDDAIQAAVNRQKAKKSTVDSLSNEDLRATVERMQLEANYNRLAQKLDHRSTGRKIIDGLLELNMELDAVRKNATVVKHVAEMMVEKARKK